MATAILIFALAYIYIGRKKYVLKHIFINNMVVLYENMEIYIAKNNTPVDGNLIDFLKAHKNIAVNPEFADIDVFMGLKRKMKVNKKTGQNNIKLDKIPKELLDMSKEINVNFVKLLRLSMLKWSFLRLCMFCSLIILFEYFFHIGRYIDAFFEKVLGRRFSDKNELRTIILNSNSEGNNLIIPI